MPYLSRVLASLLVAGLAATTPGHAAATLELTVSPHAAYSWNYSGGHAEFNYTVHLAKAPAWLCTGWVYPIYQWYPDQWPMRRSCRLVDRRIIQESWGGRRMPLPHIGVYNAFAELYASEEASRPSVTVTQAFQVLEGLPSP